MDADTGLCSILLLLELSASWDTVDHKNIIEHFGNLQKQLLNGLHHTNRHTHFCQDWKIKLIFSISWLWRSPRLHPGSSINYYLYLFPCYKLDIWHLIWESTSLSIVVKIIPGCLYLLTLIWLYILLLQSLLMSVDVLTGLYMFGCCCWYVETSSFSQRGHLNPTFMLISARQQQMSK